MKIDFDIDIDFKDRDSAIKALGGIPAMRETKDGPKIHNSGLYFQRIPYDVSRGYARVNFREAAELGYMKVDFLNFSLYDDFESEKEIDEYLSMEPVWEAFECREIVENLYHIGDHFSLVNRMKPKTIEELAMLLAVIRPSKKHLRNLSWDEVRKDVWEKPTDGSYYFKKSHAFSYAIAIILQLNKLLVDLSY